MAQSTSVIITIKSDSEDDCSQFENDNCRKRRRTLAQNDLMEQLGENKRIIDANNKLSELLEKTKTENETLKKENEKILEELSKLKNKLSETVTDKMKDFHRKYSTFIRK
uniref:BZIP domain-containing protein n=1 Tax=Meloidogyne hapla TaxID=6305 RepID=A0A1I8B6S1_MELHA